MTYTPTPVVEVAFGFGPYDEPSPGDWIDVTDYVLEVSTQRGRESEFEQFPAGTATVTLLNDARQFDPLNTTGDHYGDLVANVPIRIYADLDGTDHHVWRGFVDGWPAEYTDGGYRSEVKVQCTDAFKILAERPMLDTFATFLADFEAPVAWYRFETMADQTLLNDLSVGQPGRVVAQVDLVEGLNVNSESALRIPPQWSEYADTFERAVEFPISSNADNLMAGTSWTISVWAQGNEPGLRGIFDFIGPSGAFRGGIHFHATAPAGRIRVYVDNGVGTTINAITPTVLTDGLPHHIVAVRFGTSVFVYVDGLHAVTGANAAMSAAIDGAGGRNWIGRTSTGPAEYPGITVDDLMAWDRALSETEIAELHQAMSVGEAVTQAAGTAIHTILDEVGWPASLRAVDVGEAVVRLPANLVGYTALDLLQNVTRSEGGRLYVDAEGKVTFHSRSRFLSEAVEQTVQYEFTDVDRDSNPTDVGIRDGTLSVTIDDRTTYDAAEITREGGQTQRATLVTNPARTYSASGLLLATDVAAKSLAQWIPFRWGTPQPRSEEWEVDPEVLPADWADILTLDIGHRIRHSLTPGGVGSAIELDQHLSVIGHEITAEEWIVTLNGTPTDPNETAYFLWATTATADDNNGWADSDGDPPGGYWG